MHGQQHTFGMHCESLLHRQPCSFKSFRGKGVICFCCRVVAQSSWARALSVRVLCDLHLSTESAVQCNLHVWFSHRTDAFEILCAVADRHWRRSTKIQEGQHDLAQHWPSLGRGAAMGAYWCKVCQAVWPKTLCWHFDASSPHPVKGAALDMWDPTSYCTVTRPHGRSLLGLLVPWTSLVVWELQTFANPPIWQICTLKILEQKDTCEDLWEGKRLLRLAFEQDDPDAAPGAFAVSWNYVKSPPVQAI